MAKVALPSSAAVPVGTLPASLMVGLGSVAGLTSWGSRDLEGRQGRMDASTLSADPHRSVGSSLIADLPLLAKAPQLEQFVDRPRLEPLLAELKPLTQARDHLQGSLEGGRQKEVEATRALQALGRNQCPSCERSLTRSEGQLPNFCMHCGLQIQRDCTRCNRHHLSFFPYRSPSPGRHEVEARDMRRRLRCDGRVQFLRFASQGFHPCDQLGEAGPARRHGRHAAKLECC